MIGSGRWWWWRRQFGPAIVDIFTLTFTGCMRLRRRVSVFRATRSSAVWDVSYVTTWACCIGRQALFGLYCRRFVIRSVLRPRYFGCIALTDEATACAVVTWLMSQKRCVVSKQTKTYTQAWLHRTSSYVFCMCHSQFWFGWQIASEC